MIFSFSSTTLHPALKFTFEGDIFCFFLVSGAVLCSKEFGLNCLLSTLRLKKPVLLLSAPRAALPEINTSKRWDLGEDWVWIAPRAHSHLSDNYPDLGLDFVPIKTFLTTPN